MPSEHQSAHTRERMRCRSLAEDIDEDPARWLDWDLLADSTRADIVRTLIDGMDSLQRVRAWRAVERRLAARDDRDPRAPIMQRLDRREQWLDRNGERPARLPYGPRESCDCCGVDGFLTAADLRERRAEEATGQSKGYDPIGVDTSETTPETEEVGLDAFATDGGVEE